MQSEEELMPEGQGVFAENNTRTHTAQKKKKKKIALGNNVLTGFI